MNAAYSQSTKNIFSTYAYAYSKRAKLGHINIWKMVYASYALLPRELKDQKKLSRFIIISH